MKFEGNWNTRWKQYTDELKVLTSEETGSFSSFKQAVDYIHIVGGIDNTGQEGFNIFCDEIEKKYSHLLKDMKKFQKNDKYGQPVVQETRYGQFSPNTLRYVWTLGHIEKILGSLEEKNIIEIGSAYGGLCFIISQRHKYKSYTLIDLPDSILLSKKYLSLLSIKNVIFQDTNNIESKESDLVISNSALSELDDIGINFYVDNILFKSKSFYMNMNLWDEGRQKVLYKKLSKRFNIKIEDDIKVIKSGIGIWIGESK